MGGGGGDFWSYALCEVAASILQTHRPLSWRSMLQAMRGTIIVEPLYDAGGRIPTGTSYAATDAKIEGFEYHGLVLPATGDNSQSQQGLVIASAIDEFVPGMLAAYMPFHGIPVKLKGEEYLTIPERELAGWLDPYAEGCHRICPRKGWLLVKPEWPDEKVGHLYLPEHSGLHEPVLLGSVLRCGAFTTLEVGTRLVMAPDAGFEIGLLDVGENLYLLNEQHVLATVTNA